VSFVTFVVNLHAFGFGKDWFRLSMAGGTPHLAPMGPHVPGADFDRFTLRAVSDVADVSQSSSPTAKACCHITDDVLLLAKAALGPVEPSPEYAPAVQRPRLGAGRLLSVLRISGLRRLTSSEQRVSHRGCGGSCRSAAGLFRIQSGEARSFGGGGAGDPYRITARMTRLPLSTGDWR